MIQTLYGLLAIGLVMVFALNLVRTTTRTDQKMILNEVGTQVTGIAVDLLEHIGNRSFDENTKEEGVATADFPLVTSPGELTPEAGFGGCPDLYDADCDDIDDFDGMSIDRSVEGIPYTAGITVRYVDVDDPNYAPGTQTWAKEVIIDVTSPYLLIGGDPINVTLSRVFTYKRITS